MDSVWAKLLKSVLIFIYIQGLHSFYQFVKKELSSQHQTQQTSISTISTDIPLSLPLLLLAPSLFSSSPCLFYLMNFWCCMFLSGVLGSRPSVVWRRLGQDATRLSFIFIHLLASRKQYQGVALGSDWLSVSVGLHDGNVPEGKAGAISLWHALVRDHCWEISLFWRW